MASSALGSEFFRLQDLHVVFSGFSAENLLFLLFPHIVLFALEQNPAPEKSCF